MRCLTRVCVLGVKILRASYWINENSIENDSKICYICLPMFLFSFLDSQLLPTNVVFGDGFEKVYSSP